MVSAKLNTTGHLSSGRWIISMACNGGLAIVLSSVIQIYVDRTQADRLAAQVIAGIEPGTRLLDAVGILQSRSFFATRGILDEPTSNPKSADFANASGTNNGNFDFSDPPADPNAVLTYFLGGRDHHSFMVRLEHRNEIVVAAQAEPLRFEKDG